MHRSRTPAAVGAVLALALTGCGADPQPDTAAAASTTPPAAPATTPAAAPPSATASSELTIGKTVTIYDNRVTATVLDYRQPVGDDAPKPSEPGYTWGAAEVKVCMKVDGLSVNRHTWVLTYADGAIIKPTSRGYTSHPRPGFPSDDQQVKAGQCVRGWITYPVPAAASPQYVQYQPEGLEPTGWRLK